MGQFLLIPQDRLVILEEKINNIMQYYAKERNRTMDDWISGKETQELLGLKATSLWALRKKKVIRHSKIGSKIFYSLKSIEKYLEKNQE